MIQDPSIEVQRISESYLMSGGLLKDQYVMRWKLIDRSEDDVFIQEVFENSHEKYTALWECLDGAVPEPVWKRKKMGVSVRMRDGNEFKMDLELRILAVITMFHHGVKALRELVGMLGK